MKVTSAITKPSTPTLCDLIGHDQAMEVHTFNRDMADFELCRVKVARATGKLSPEAASEIISQLRLIAPTTAHSCICVINRATDNPARLTGPADAGG